MRKFVSGCAKCNARLWSCPCCNYIIKGCKHNIEGEKL